MFEGPEHESYVVLMCELRLERVLEPGDWIWWLMEDEVGIFPLDEGVPAVIYPGGGPTQFALQHRHWFWLPRLDQWLSMLEEAGRASITIGHAERAGGYHAFVPAANPREDGQAEVIVREGHFVTLVSDNVPTREEATASLFLAVTGREAPRG